jgi:hypothetical protein
MMMSSRSSNVDRERETQRKPMACRTKTKLLIIAETIVAVIEVLVIAG